MGLGTSDEKLLKSHIDLFQSCFLLERRMVTSIFFMAIKLSQLCKWLQKSKDSPGYFLSCICDLQTLRFLFLVRPFTCITMSAVSGFQLRRPGPGPQVTCYETISTFAQSSASSSFHLFFVFEPVSFRTFLP